MEHTMEYLDDVSMNKQGIGLEKYKQIMENKFLAELNGSLQYNELQYFEGFLE
jgi:folylpolyglutamate synthase/dihydropteroate synthase